MKNKDYKSDWDLPCPNCKSTERKKGFGCVMHSSGYNKKGRTSTYSFQCCKCNKHFSKQYDYGNKEIVIKLEGKIIEREPLTGPSDKELYEKYFIQKDWRQDGNYNTK